MSRAGRVAILGKTSVNQSRISRAVSNFKVIYGSKTKIVILWTPKPCHWPGFMATVGNVG